MEKYGRVRFAGKDKEYQFMWYSTTGVFERIDIFENLEHYNRVDTSNCDSAFYCKTREMFLNDDSLVKEFIKAKRSAVVFKGTAEQTTEIVEGKVRIVQTKKNIDIGMEVCTVSENGLVVFEKYVTPECTIVVDIVKKDLGIDFPPINLSSYAVIDLIDNSLILKSGTAEFYPLEYLKAKYPIDHIDNNDFVVAKSMEEGRARLGRWKNADTKVKAVDIESTGTAWTMFGEDVITGIVMSYSETESTYYPFRQENFKYNLPITFIEEILDAINNQPDDVVITGHNAKVEKQAIWKEDKNYITNSEYAINFAKENKTGIGLVKPDLRIDADSFLESILVDPVFRKGRHALKNLVMRIEGKFYLELDEIFKDKKNIRFNMLPEEIVRYYACPDTANTIKVYKYLMNKLPGDELGIFQLENELLEVTAENEFYGMRIDTNKLVSSLENSEYIAETLKKRFQQIHKTTKNINSNDVRRDIFYNKLRCPVEVRTKTGKPSTSNIALKRIVELGTLRNYNKDKIPPAIVDLNNKPIIEGEDLISNRYPSLVILEKYAKAVKELGALRRIERKSIKGRVFFNLNQAGAATGRQTSDAHQYSDTMKSLVLSDSEQHYLWSADFKQVELRILPYLAGQEDLIELEKDPEVDAHRAYLSILTSKEIWAISDKERKEGKSTNLGVVYMMSEWGLAKKNAGPAYSKDDVLKARNAITGFYNGFPKIKEFSHSNEEFVRKNGYMKTAFKRYRYFEEILDPTYPEKKKQSIIRAANNSPVQGFGADYLKVVEVTMQKYIKEKGWNKKVDCDGVMLPMVRIMLSIHDELLVSTHKSIPIEEIIIMFKECMEQEVKGAPPFFSAPALIDNWYLGKDPKYEIDLGFRDMIIEAWKKDGTSLLHVETYLSDLDAYRSNRIKEYMEGLIRKYKTVDAVADHVRHPELTHTLITIFKTNELHLEHTEAIKEAVKRYMAKRDAGEVEGILAESDSLVGVKDEIDILHEDDDLDKYIEFDENGEMIVDEEEDEEEDDLWTLTEESALSIQHEPEKTYAVYMLNEVMIDLSEYSLDDEEAEMINQSIAKISKADNHYHVLYFINGRVIKTNLKIDYCPETINKIFADCKSVGTELLIVNDAVEDCIGTRI